MNKFAGKRIARIAAFCLALVVVVLILVRVFQNAEIFTICSGVNFAHPHVHQNQVAWYDGYNLFLYDHSSRKTETLSHFVYDRRLRFMNDPMTSFSNEWLVWIDPTLTIAGYKLDSIRLDPEIIPINHLVEFRFPIGATFFLVAGGDFVVWEDSRNGSKDIFGFNLKTRKEFPICTDPDHQIDPDTDGNLVVWAQVKGGEGMGIDGYNLKTGDTLRICDQPDARFRPRVSGRYVIWSQDDYSQGIRTNSIGGKDLLTGLEFTIGQPDHLHLNPDISGSIVVWTDVQEIVEDIHGYDIETGREFVICDDQGAQASPAIDGRFVTWFDEGRQSLWRRITHADTSCIRGRILTDQLIYGKSNKTISSNPPDP